MLKLPESEYLVENLVIYASEKFTPAQPFQPRLDEILNEASADCFDQRHWLVLLWGSLCSLILGGSWPYRCADSFDWLAPQSRHCRPRLPRPQLSRNNWGSNCQLSYPKVENPFGKEMAQTKSSYRAYIWSPQIRQPNVKKSGTDGDSINALLCGCALIWESFLVLVQKTFNPASMRKQKLLLAYRNLVFVGLAHLLTHSFRDD